MLTDKWREANIKEAIKIAELRYGKINVDWNNLWGIVIKMDDFEILNEEEDSHLIKGFYFCIGNFNNLNAFRSIITYPEYRAKYGHSHLNSSLDFNLEGAFCLGSNTVISKIWEKLINKFDPNDFEEFLDIVDSYLRWESLSTGPYRTISSIRTSMNTNISINTFSEINNTTYKEIERIFSNFIHDSDFDYDITVNNNIIVSKIKDTPELNDRILKLIPNLGDLYDDKGIRFSNKPLSQLDVDKQVSEFNKNSPSIIFKNKEIVTTIEPYSVKELDTNRYKMKFHDSAHIRVYTFINKLINDKSEKIFTTI